MYVRRDTPGSNANIPRKARKDVTCAASAIVMNMASLVALNMCNSTKISAERTAEAIDGELY